MNNRRQIAGIAAVLVEKKFPETLAQKIQSGRKGGSDSNVGLKLCQDINDGVKAQKTRPRLKRLGNAKSCRRRETAKSRSGVRITGRVFSESRLLAKLTHESHAEADP